MRKKKRVDRVEMALRNARLEERAFEADPAWQRSLMDRIREEGRAAERSAIEFPVWRFAWAAAAMAVALLGTSLLTTNAGWIPDNYLFDVRQTVIDF